MIYDSIYVDRGSNYWDNVAKGWGLDPRMIAAQQNQPVFVWSYNTATKAWTHSVVSPFTGATANEPAPGTGPAVPPPPDAGTATWKIIAGVGAVVALAGIVWFVGQPWTSTGIARARNAEARLGASTKRWDPSSGEDNPQRLIDKKRRAAKRRK